MAKIVYTENNEDTARTGTIIKQDDKFYYLERQNGIMLINKDKVVKVELNVGEILPECDPK